MNSTGRRGKDVTRKLSFDFFVKVSAKHAFRDSDDSDVLNIQITRNCTYLSAR